MLHDSIVAKITELGIRQPARLPKLFAIWCQPLTYVNSTDGRAVADRNVWKREYTALLPNEKENLRQNFNYGAAQIR